MPAGPPPTTSTRPGLATTAEGGRVSRPTAGFTEQEIASPYCSRPAHPSTVAMHGRIRSGCLPRALVTQSSSASGARVSAAPSGHSQAIAFSTRPSGVTAENPTVASAVP